VPGQLELALGNVSAALAAAGMSVKDVVQLRTFVVGTSDPAQRRAVFEAWLGDHRPCMTLVQVAGLAAPQFLVEVEALACREDRSAG
jgi:enamine deaminase RidA (YjgF/YER057c/UK114 family)